MGKAKTISYLKVTVDDRPGTLLSVAEKLKSKNLGLLALKGQAGASGQGDIYLFPKKAEKAANALQKAGLSFEEGSCFLMKGTDATGALVKPLNALAAAGVNLRAIEAVAVGGKYATLFWFAPEDTDRAAAALSAKK